MQILSRRKTCRLYSCNCSNEKSNCSASCRAIHSNMYSCIYYLCIPAYKTCWLTIYVNNFWSILKWYPNLNWTTSYWSNKAFSLLLFSSQITLKTLDCTRKHRLHYYKDLKNKKLSGWLIQMTGFCTLTIQTLSTWYI